jgi:hypothetical protein
MKLPDEVVAVFQTALPAEGGKEESKKISPNTKVILEHVRKTLGPERSHVMSQITDVLDGKAPSKKNRRYRNIQEVLQSSKLKTNDTIASGFGQLNPLNEFKPMTESSSVTEELVNHPGFRNAAASSSRREAMDAHIRRGS